MSRPTKPGFYLYRKQVPKNHDRPGRTAIAHVIRGRDGKLYATLLKHYGWKMPKRYPVGCMGGTWSERIKFDKPPVA